jgi:hypothetical protein
MKITPNRLDSVGSADTDFAFVPAITGGVKPGEVSGGGGAIGWLTAFNDIARPFAEAELVRAAEPDASVAFSIDGYQVNQSSWTYTPRAADVQNDSSAPFVPTTGNVGDTRVEMGGIIPPGTSARFKLPDSAITMDTGELLKIVANARVYGDVQGIDYRSSGVVLFQYYGFLLPYDPDAGEIYE